MTQLNVHAGIDKHARFVPVRKIWTTARGVIRVTLYVRAIGSKIANLRARYHIFVALCFAMTMTETLKRVAGAQSMHGGGIIQ